MLHLIFGRAGSGKTEYARQLVCDCVNSGQTVFAIVPEQSSFDCERVLLQRLGPQKVRRAEVLSFTRLCDYVGRAHGGFAGRRLNDTGRALFMSLAVEQVRDRLTLYRRAAEGTDFIELLLGMASACKMGAVRPEQLSTAVGSENTTLHMKAEELGLILGAYDALVAEQFLDPQDDLTRLAAQLRTHRVFADQTLVLDAFKGFTAQEFEVLEQLMSQARDCYITLCTDQLYDSENGTGLFSNVRRTARRLIDCAKRHNVPVAAPVLLESGKRFHSDALRAAEAQLFRNEPHRAVVPDGSVMVAAAVNKYEEADWIAAEIHRMVREEGYRWRDFTVIVRREEDYSGVLDRALRRADIPFFMDQPVDITGTPLMAYVLAALEAANSRMESDAVFRCLKTGLFGFSAEQLAELENYVFLWSIDRDAWLSEWKGNPQGFSEQFTDEDAQTLQRLNMYRAQITVPFDRLMHALRTGNGRDMAAAVYRFLTDTQATQHLSESCDALQQDGETDVAAQQLRLWKLLMELLDQTALVLQMPLDGKRYARLLELAIRSAKLGELPQSLDEVTVGGADRTRPSAPKIVFLAGAVQGIFPAASSTGGLFTEAERRVLEARGIELVRSAGEQTVEERFLAYTAACSPSERLIVTYYTTASGGEGVLPSELVAELRSLCPEQTVCRCSRAEMLPETAAEALDRLAAAYTQPSVMQATLRALFAQPAYADTLQAMERAAQPQPFAFTHAETARRLFGEHMYLSPSRLENYYQCPFQYFCRYGMDARERRPAKIDALEYGTLIHYLLEMMLRTHKGDELIRMDETALRTAVHQWLDVYLNERLGGAEGKSERFLALYARFETVAVRLLRYIAQELTQSRFVPAAFEVPIGGKDSTVQPVHIPLPDGGSIEIIGKIDRVDLMQTENETYVRVIDYKTGHKKFALSDLLYGINMQMLIYLMTLHENGFADANPIPAGVLYLPARSPRLSAAHADSDEALEEQALTAMRMSGIVLRDEQVLHGMERAGRGFFIPVKYKQDGTPDARSMLYTMEEFGVMARHMKKLIAQMGEQLHAGAVSAVPTGETCRFCSFAAVCGHEKEDPIREIGTMSNREVFQKMREEEEMAHGSELDNGTAGCH